jgi:hypothetical protein
MEAEVNVSILDSLYSSALSSEREEQIHQRLGIGVDERRDLLDRVRLGPCAPTSP